MNDRPKPPPSSRRNSRRGFTLIEVIAVLVVLTIVGAIIVSSTTRSNANLATEADRLTAHLRHTQLQAQADIYNWQLAFTGDTYQLGPVLPAPAGFTPAIIPGTGATAHTLSPGTTASGGPVTFDSWGRASGSEFKLSDGREISIVVVPQTGLIP